MDRLPSSLPQEILDFYQEMLRRSDRRLQVSKTPGRMDVQVSRLTPRTPQMNAFMLMMCLGVLLGILGLGVLIGVLRLLFDPALEQSISLAVFAGLFAFTRYSMVPSLLDQVRLEFREGRLVVSQRRWLFWKERGRFAPGDDVELRWKKSLLPTHPSALPLCLELVARTQTIALCRRRPVQEMQGIAGLVRQFLDGKPIAELDFQSAKPAEILCESKASTPLVRLHRLGYIAAGFSAIALLTLVIAPNFDLDLPRIADNTFTTAVVLWMAGRAYVAPWKPRAIPTFSEAIGYLPTAWIAATILALGVLAITLVPLPFLPPALEIFHHAAPIWRALAIGLCTYPFNRALLLKELSLPPEPPPVDDDPYEHPSEE